MMKNGSKDDESFLVKLKSEIEDTLGKKISNSGDCIFLCEQILDKLSYNVSIITLRRFFGLVKSSFNPSSTTLDILSKYCGFSGFHEFKSLRNNSYISIDENFYANSILNYLVSIFKNTPTKDRNDQTFMAVVEYAIPFLQRHPELIDKFHRAIAKTKNGQEFYFEQFINLDEINSFYGDGLRYYLMEKNTNEAQILGHSLLCLRYWLSDNAPCLKKHYDSLMKISYKNLSPLLQSQYLAAKLLYANINGLSCEKIINEMEQMYIFIKPGAGNDLVAFIEYIFSSVLLLAGKPGEALDYFSYSSNNYSKKSAGINSGFYQSKKLFKALTLIKTGQMKAAEKLYYQLHPLSFYHLKRKTCMVLYLFLSQHLKKNTGIMDQQLNNLIEETGFTRLRQVFL